MPRVNVELRARDRDPDATAARCAAVGAQDREVVVQRDTYFGARQGRLKLRKRGGAGAELIAYRRRRTEPISRARVKVPVYLGRPGEMRETVTLAELLPGAFGREELHP